MPRHDTISVPAGTWTQLTNADVTEISFQNVSAFTPIRVQFTAGTTPPTSTAGANRYSPESGEDNLTLATRALGVSGANRAWVYSDQKAEVVVSHA